MIIERVMLFRIEHFQQRGRRITAPVATQFVDLIQQDHGVYCFGASHRLQDAARHGADIRAPMPTNLGFVAYAAERHADKASAERLCDGAPEGGLADTWRPNQAENGPANRANLSQHGDVIEDAILHFLETVVIAVQHGARLLDVDGIVAACRPRQAQRPVQPATSHRRIGRHGRGASKLPQFPLRAQGNGLRQSALGDLTRHLFAFVAVFLAQFPVYSPQLFLQKKLALVLEQRTAHLVVDLSFQLEQLEFTAQQLHQSIAQDIQGGRFQQALAMLDGNVQMRRNAEREALLVIQPLQQPHDFRGKAALQSRILFEQRHCMAHAGMRRFVVGQFEREGGHRGFEQRTALGGGKPLHLHATQPFDQNLGGPAGQTRDLLQSPDHAHPMQVSRRRRVNVGGPLGDDQDFLGALSGLRNGSQ